MSPVAEHPEPAEVAADLRREANEAYALRGCSILSAAFRAADTIDRLTRHDRERKALNAAVVAFVDACCPTYSTDAADGPADLIPALEDAAARLIRLTAENERLRTDLAAAHRRLVLLEAVAEAVTSSYDYLIGKGLPTSSIVRERLAAAALPGVPEPEPCAITTGRMGYDWCSTHGHRADVCPGAAPGVEPGHEDAVTP